MSSFEYVVGVSWPRSGHHLLKRMLTSYFGPEFGYCEHYKPSDCCRAVPCVRSGAVNFSKNHDYKSSFPILNGYNYIVQYRQFIPSAVSNYELFVRNRGEDSFALFEKFCTGELKRYVLFLRRWTSARLECGVIARVSYETLCGAPREVMTTLIPLFAPREPIDQGRLDTTIATAEYITVEDGVERPADERGVRERRSTRSFRHFNEPLFRKLDEGAREAYECMTDLPLIQRSDRPTIFGTMKTEMKYWPGFSSKYLFVDATGMLAWAGKNPTGIPRVHDFLLRLAFADTDPAVQLVIFDKDRDCYRRLSPNEKNIFFPNEAKQPPAPPTDHPREPRLQDALKRISRHSPSDLPLDVKIA